MGTRVKPAYDDMTALVHKQIVRMTFAPAKIFRVATRPWFGPFARTRGVVKVTVRDENFRVVRVLKSEPDLPAFRALWSAMIEVDPGTWTPPPGQPYHHLIIEWTGRGDRNDSGHWFHHPG